MLGLRPTVDDKSQLTLRQNLFKEGDEKVVILLSQMVHNLENKLINSQNADFVQLHSPPLISLAIKLIFIFCNKCI